MLFPRKGIIIDTSAELMIRLTSGARVCVPQQKDLRLGDTCYVLYDYTRMLVNKIWTEDEYHRSDDPNEEVEEADMGPYEEDIIQALINHVICLGVSL